MLVWINTVLHEYMKKQKRMQTFCIFKTLKIAKIFVFAHLYLESHQLKGDHVLIPPIICAPSLKLLWNNR